MITYKIGAVDPTRTITKRLLHPQFKTVRKSTPSWRNFMSLDATQIEKIAALSRLTLAPDQVPVLEQQLNNIMGLADRLGAENTEGVEPLAHPLSLILPIALRLRDDVVTETDQRAANMSNAPAAQDGLFLVPKVIE
jgi:aspartyl-tRNA(Asn)/glutamyl-tRNA(Gln) amidotransferase subunit C